MAIPLSTADSERDFSRLGIIKTARRNRLSNETLNHLMEISIDGPSVAKFPFCAALEKFHDTKRRRLPRASETVWVRSTADARDCTLVVVPSNPNSLCQVSTISKSKESDLKHSLLQKNEKQHSASTNRDQASQSKKNAAFYSSTRDRTIASFFLGSKNATGTSTVESLSKTSLLTQASSSSQFASQTTLKMVNLTRVSPLPTSYSEWELLLPHVECQSLIGGRNGSNACTTVVSRSPNSLRPLMCESMVDGNRLYDALGIRGLYSCREAVNLMPAIGVTDYRDTFITPHQCQDIVGTLVEEAARNEDAHSAGVLIVQPYSFAVFLKDSLFILFDRHGHGNKGALLSVIPSSDATGYLEYFLKTYYSMLQFDGTIPKVARLTLLKLSG